MEYKKKRVDKFIQILKGEENVKVKRKNKKDEMHGRYCITKKVKK